MTGWQAVAQAADAGLVLTHTLPFVAEQGYAPSDYKPERPGDGFRVEGARWHVCMRRFRLLIPPAKYGDASVSGVRFY